MSDIGRVLNTAKEALISQASAINITGSNIANVNTPGYSRLRAVFSSVGVSQSGSSNFQVGVQVVNADRIYDQYLEARLVYQSQEVGYGETLQSGFDRVESIFNESGENGINEAMSAFWNAWDDLSANPSGQVERDTLVSCAENLTSLFRQKAQDLADVQADANAAVADTVTAINSCLTDIAAYNEKIVEITSGGGNASDLLDKRMESLKELGGLIHFDYIEDATGAVSVFLADGKPLVEGGTTWPLDVAANSGNSNFYDVVFEGSTAAENSVITGGKIAAYLEIRDEAADGYLTKLNTLAAGLANAVNTQHQLGFDADGNLGGNFFDSITEAADMQVSAAIKADAGKIAASGSVADDGDNAVAMAAIKDSLLMEGGTSTLSTYYSALMAEVGQDAADAADNMDRQDAMMTQLTNQREAVSGVSLDEEMLNLIKYQMGYNAAGKLCGVVDEMMDTLLALVAK